MTMVCLPELLTAFWGFYYTHVTQALTFRHPVPEGVRSHWSPPGSLLPLPSPDVTGPPSSTSLGTMRLVPPPPLRTGTRVKKELLRGVTPGHGDILGVMQNGTGLANIPPGGPRLAARRDRPGGRQSEERLSVNSYQSRGIEGLAPVSGVGRGLPGGEAGVNRWRRQLAGTDTGRIGGKVLLDSSQPGKRGLTGPIARGSSSEGGVEESTLSKHWREAVSVGLSRPGDATNRDNDVSIGEDGDNHVALARDPGHAGLRRVRLSAAVTAPLFRQTPTAASPPSAAERNAAPPPPPSHVPRPSRTGPRHSPLRGGKRRSRDTEIQQHLQEKGVQHIALTTPGDPNFTAKREDRQHRVLSTTHAPSSQPSVQQSTSISTSHSTVTAISSSSSGGEALYVATRGRHGDSVTASFPPTTTYPLFLNGNPNAVARHIVRDQQHQSSVSGRKDLTPPEPDAGSSSDAEGEEEEEEDASGAHPSVTPSGADQRVSDARTPSSGPGTRRPSGPPGDSWALPGERGAEAEGGGGGGELGAGGGGSTSRSSSRSTTTSTTSSSTTTTAGSGSGRAGAGSSSSSGTEAATSAADDQKEEGPEEEEEEEEEVEEEPAPDLALTSDYQQSVTTPTTTPDGAVTADTAARGAGRGAVGDGEGGGPPPGGVRGKGAGDTVTASAARDLEEVTSFGHVTAASIPSTGTTSPSTATTSPERGVDVSDARGDAASTLPSPPPLSTSATQTITTTTSTTTATPTSEELRTDLPLVGTTQAETHRVVVSSASEGTATTNPPPEEGTESNNDDDGDQVSDVGGDVTSGGLVPLGGGDDDAAAVAAAAATTRGPAPGMESTIECDGRHCYDLYGEVSYNLTPLDANGTLYAGGPAPGGGRGGGAAPDETDVLHWEILLLLVVVLAGITGNVLVCIAVSIERKLQNVTNYFLMSLAVADLFVSLIVMPCSIVHELMGYWPFGLVMCDIWQVLDVMMCTSSIMHMCTISLDRYIAIRHPLKNRNKSRTVVGVKIATVWFISLAIASPIIMLSLLDPENVLYDETCAIFNHYFLIYGSLGAFFIPLIIMLIAYSLTIHLLNAQAQLCAEKSKSGAPVMRRSISKRRRSLAPMLRSRDRSRTPTAEKAPAVNGLSIARKIQSHLDRNNAHPSETEPLHRECRNETDNSTANSSPTLSMARLSRQCSREAGGKSPRLQALVMKHSAAIKVASVLIAKGKETQNKKTMNTVKTERKAVKVLGTMFAIFVLSWGPFFSLNFAMGICSNCDIDVALFKVFLWLGYVSSTLNPIIYTIFNKTFKRTFIRILQCKFYTRKLQRFSSVNQTNGGSIRVKYDATATTTALAQNESMV